MSLVLVRTNNKTKLFSLGGVATTVLISTISLLSFDVFADDVIDEVTLSIPVSCTMTGVGMDTHTVTLKNGQANSNVGETTIKAYCNDIEGFAIYAIGFTDNEDGKNVLTDSSLGSNYDIVTGTATGPVNNVDNSNWAMKLSTVTSPTPTYPLIIAGSTDDTEREQGDLDYSTFQPVPDSYALVAKRNANTDIGTNAEGSTLKTTYQIYVSTTQTAGTYNGQVKYTLVHPASEVPLQPQTAQSGCINYFPNGSGVEGTMGCQSIAETDTSATLLASNFSRTGYGFAGWSNKYDYATNPNQEGIKFYGPQEDITFTAGQYTGDSNGLSLYAVWVKSAGSLQETNKVAELCGTGANALTTAPTDGTANLSSVSALTDQRDNETYAIAKLADGKCWMIENLRLDNTNSDNSTGALAQGYGTSATYGNFSGLADPESTGFSSTYSANSLYSNDGSNGTINIGTSNYPAYRMPRYNNLNTTNRASSPTSNSFSNDNTTGGMYSYGNYYTWHAAIADLTYNGTSNSSVTNTSLCPAGWKLPQGGNKTRIESNDDNDFWNLTVDALNGGTNPANYDSQTYPYYTGIAEAGPVAAKLRSYPNNLLYSGYVIGGSLYNRGAYGLYWSSTADDSYSAYSLTLTSSFVNPGTNDGSKYFGSALRCIANP